MKNSDSTTTKVIKKAFLIATYQGSGAIGAAEKLACEEHLNELDLLVDTFGSSVVHKEACHLRQFDAATFLTKGKLAGIPHRSFGRTCQSGSTLCSNQGH